MRFPEINSPWPPKEYAPALAQVANDDAWLTLGGPGVTTQVGPVVHPTQFNGGLVGAGARALLGKPPSARGTISDQRHLDLASQLVDAKATMVAGKPPIVSLHEDDADNAKAIEALNALVGTDTFAAEYTTAVGKSGSHGWRFGRVVWNQQVYEHPWVEWVDADGGFSMRENGREVAVMFWDAHQGQKDTEVYRLFQLHVPGRIEYQLYLGDQNTVGRPVPFEEHQATAYLADLVDAESGFDTGIPPELGIITATMIPNGDVNPAWRSHPQLRYYGRSDVDKGRHVWADLDSVHSDFIHDVGSARARLFVNEGLLDNLKPGDGQWFDQMRDVYRIAESGTPSENQIERVQFQIRAEDYLRARNQLILDGVDAVGLSPITVGKDHDATGTMTAREITARSKKSLETFNKVARQERAGLSRILTAWLWLDADLNNYAPPTRPILVALHEPVDQTALELAEEIEALHRSDSISMWYRVRKAHPEWDEPEVNAEVERIRADLQAGMPTDPFSIGMDIDPEES